jgi:hypothetical protein
MTFLRNHVKITCIWLFYEEEPLSSDVLNLTIGFKCGYVSKKVHVFSFHLEKNAS